MRRRLSMLETHVWEMHMSGMSVPDIARAARLDQDDVRSTICGIWRDGGKVHKYGD